MVTKLKVNWLFYSMGSVLAKIHMVTKPLDVAVKLYLGSVLAKIHMVTKLTMFNTPSVSGSVLAKIHMVTKLVIRVLMR